MTWPKHYCVEQTIEVPLHAGRLVRLWFDAAVVTVRDLDVVYDIVARIHPGGRQLTEILDEVVAWVGKGMNAIQVLGNPTAFGRRDGVMAYLVPFDAGESPSGARKCSYGCGGSHLPGAPCTPLKLTAADNIPCDEKPVFAIADVQFLREIAEQLERIDNVPPQRILDQDAVKLRNLAERLRELPTEFWDNAK